MMKINLYYTILIYLVIGMLQTLSANTFSDLDAGITHDDNLTRSDYSNDKKSDFAMELYADYGNYYELANNWGVTASIFVHATNYSTYTRLSSLGYGITASGRKKLGLGAYSSSLLVSARYGQYNVQDNQRDNTFYELGLGWDKRLTDRWAITAGLNIDNAKASNSTFDIQGTTYYLSADYTINDNLLLNMGISQRKGDIVTITNSNMNPSEKIYNYLSKASAGKNSADTVFGSGLTAYQVNATTTTLNAGLSYTLNKNSSINASYELQNAELPYGINYVNNIYRLNYVYRF